MNVSYGTKSELYKMLRNQIQHEDGLVNQRLTWLLLSQAFLFTAYFTTLNKFFDLNKVTHLMDKIFLAILLFLIPLAALFLVFLGFRSINGAFEAIRILREFWFYNFPEEGVADKDNPYNFKITNSDVKPSTHTKQFQDITYIGDVGKGIKLTKEKRKEILDSTKATMRTMFNKGLGSRTTAFSTPMVMFCMWSGLVIMKVLYIILYLILHVVFKINV